ncbi:hypothetical protein QAD02_011076 [Eretmocerus hayati]|uniref:Uncharacterized protein n=1 Tax=Eretmocerus hayati TaxID=131215 RepID=A0ACC2NVR5_9HYME|nr:hypothetical protein QAD02_011076 [Eretmocerus hayati]
MSQLYERVSDTWLSITNPDEKVIMIKYVQMAKWKCISYIGYFCIGGSIFLNVTLIPVILDFVSPLNESRPRRLLTRAEYIFDPYDFYYEYFVYYGAAAAMTLSILAAADTTYNMIMHQILGFFNIVKRRVYLSTKFPPKKEEEAYKTLVSAIQLHKESLEFVEVIESTYYLCLLLLIFNSGVLMSFGAVCIMEYSYDAIDVIKCGLFEAGAALHLFYTSWSGQLVTDESIELFQAIYMSEWYNSTKRMKTLMKIMMVRCIRPCYVTAGGLYIMNYENFGKFIKSTMSYITVLASFRG